MSVLFKLKRYIQYQWRAKTKYYIHSPFVYHFFLNVLDGEDDAKVLALKHYQSKALCEKYSIFLYRLITYFNAERILEIGPSPAINFPFLIDKKTTTLFQGLDDSSTSFLKQLGEVDVVFVNTTDSLKALSSFQLISDFVNGNSVFVLNHINDSEQMFFAWNTIKGSPQVTLSIELFQIGICFFSKQKLAKENFELRY